MSRWVRGKALKVVIALRGIKIGDEVMYSTWPDPVRVTHIDYDDYSTLSLEGIPFEPWRMSGRSVAGVTAWRPAKKEKP